MKKNKRTNSFEHEDYYWEDKNTDECILVSDLTEEEAKDALCQCIYWVDKLKNKIDRAKGGLY